MTTYRRPLIHRVTETISGWFFASLEHQVNVLTGALGLAVVAACIIAAFACADGTPLDVVIAAALK